MEKWPYPNVPVYVVCPRDGEGCSWTLHRNYLLPINSNMGQDEKDAPVAGVESTTTSTPVPPVDSEHADAGLSRIVMSSAAGNTPQSSPDQPASLRYGTWKPGTDSNGGTGISVCKEVPGHLTSGMHGLVFMSYQVCTMLSVEVQCEYTLLMPSHVCKAPFILALRAIPSM